MAPLENAPMSVDCRGCIERALQHVDAAREVLMTGMPSEGILLAAESRVVRAALELRDCDGVPDHDVALARTVVARTRRALQRALARAGRRR